MALTDVIGIDAFCRDLDFQLASQYSGFRQDSGDPRLWGEKLIAHLESLGVDPTHKTLVFSDGLDFRAPSPCTATSAAGYRPALASAPG